MILHNIMSHAEIEKVIKIAEPLVRKINIKDMNGFYFVRYLLHQKKFWLIIRFWGDCPPFPSLSQHFALSEK